ncbi:MAG TPA: DNA-binding protein [Actinomycetes bacterium]|nr:DNA-binding protein [Actinomycetes bacterium]
MATEMPDDDLPPNLPSPARRALDQAGYRRLDQLTAVTQAELGKLHGMGPKALGQLRDALHRRGLSFADER